MRVVQVAIVALMLTGCQVPPVTQTPPATPASLALGTEVRTVELHQVITHLSLKSPAFSVQYGWLCETGQARALPAGRLPVSERDLHLGFREVLEPLNFRVAKPRESVFGESEVADLRIGATVTKVEANFCFPFSGSPLLNTGAPNLAKGNTHVQILWEVFNVREGRVVYKTTTAGTFTAPDSLPNGVATMFLNAFMESLRGLAADSGFRGVVAAPPDRAQDTQGARKKH